jgi:hypothetical protein
VLKPNRIEIHPKGSPVFQGSLFFLLLIIPEALIPFFSSGSLNDPQRDGQHDPYRPILHSSPVPRSTRAFKKSRPSRVTLSDELKDSWRSTDAGFLQRADWMSTRHSRAVMIETSLWLD